MDLFLSRLSDETNLINEESHSLLTMKWEGQSLKSTEFGHQLRLFGDRTLLWFSTKSGRSAIVAFSWRFELETVKDGVINLRMKLKRFEEIVKIELWWCSVMPEKCWALSRNASNSLNLKIKSELIRFEEIRSHLISMIAHLDLHNDDDNSG
jgi:hypothetical protein